MLYKKKDENINRSLINYDGNILYKSMSEFNILFIYPDGEGHSNCLKNLSEKINEITNIKCNRFHESITYDYSISQDPIIFTTYKINDRINLYHDKYKDKNIHLVIYDFFFDRRIYFK